MITINNSTTIINGVVTASSFEMNGIQLSGSGPISISSSFLWSSGSLSGNSSIFYLSNSIIDIFLLIHITTLLWEHLASLLCHTMDYQKRLTGSNSLILALFLLMATSLCLMVPLLPTKVILNVVVSRMKY